MTVVILFGTGSAVLVDVEESLRRAGIGLAAGIVNRPGESWLSQPSRALPPDRLEPSHRALPFLVPIFTPGYRQQAAEEAARSGFSTPFTLIDPTIALPQRLDMEPGGYVNAGATLGSASRFGAFVFINRGASIGHHARFGAFVSIGPGAVVAGQVTIGTGTMVGAGATILPALTIGANAVIGAGSVVARDVPDECLAMGNPARIMRRGIGGYRGVRVT